MKKILLFILSLFFIGNVSAQNNLGLLDIANYHAVPGSSFTYSHTFPEFTQISLSLPFASPFSVVGNNVSFTISYEDFVFYFLHRDENFGDSSYEQYVDLVITQNSTGGTTYWETKYYRIEPETHNAVWIENPIERTGTGSGYLEGILRIYFYK